MYILSFSNKDNYFGLMGVHIRASFTGCAIAINALSTRHHTQIMQDNAKQRYNAVYQFYSQQWVWSEKRLCSHALRSKVASEPTNLRHAEGVHYL